MIGESTLKVLEMRGHVARALLVVIDEHSFCNMKRFSGECEVDMSFLIDTMQKSSEQT